MHRRLPLSLFFSEMAAHVDGWPLAKGGSQKISDALASYLKTLGGEIITGTTVKSLRELPARSRRALRSDTATDSEAAFDLLPPSYRWELEKYRYGPGVFKVDWALSSPIPWKSPECKLAATVHLGGSAAEIAESERSLAMALSEKPFVILAQQSLFDATRAPEGKHTAWAYCHVPNNSKIDMAERIESQVERFAPGFRDCILGRHTFTAQEYEAYNPNYIGGDIGGGVMNLLQVLARPSFRLNPYVMPIKAISSVPRQARLRRVHGMCGLSCRPCCTDYDSV